MLVAAADMQLDNREFEIPAFMGKGPFVVRVWERRAVAWFSILMALSKLVVWSVVCAGLIVGLRYSPHYAKVSAVLDMFVERVKARWAARFVVVTPTNNDEELQRLQQL